MSTEVLKEYLIDLVKSFDDDHGLPQETAEATANLLDTVFGSVVVSNRFLGALEAQEDLTNPEKSRFFFEEPEHMEPVLTAIREAEVVL